MAVSGKFDLSDNQANQWAWVQYAESNVRTSENKSDFTVNVYFRRSNNGYTSSGTMNVTVTVDGYSKTASTKFSNSGTTDSLVFTGSWTNITHKTDGSKNLPISVSASSSATGFSGSGSKTVALTTINRKSVIKSFTGNDLEGNFSVVYTAYSSSFTNKLRLSIPNVKTLQTFDNYKSGTNVYFNNDTLDYLYSYMADKPSVEIGAVIETWNGTTKIGESEQLKNTCSLDNALPLITASVVDINPKTVALTGDNNILVRYCSNAQATMSADAQKGAEIDENLYIIRNGDNTGYGTTHTFNKVEDNEFIFTAEDTRGSVGKKTLKPTMVDYVKLTCNIADNRPDALGNVTVVCNGKYFNDSFGAVDNTLTVKCRYAEAGGNFSDWIEMTVTVTGNDYIAYADFVIPNFDQQKYYEFEALASDKIYNMSSNTSIVKSTPLFHWGENDFVFEVPVTFKKGAEGATSEGDQTISGNLRLQKGDEDYGTYLQFGDGYYCYIAELEDDVMTIHASRINLDANGVYVYGKPIPDMEKGVWTPRLDVLAVSSYTTQYGWYSKLGQTVTVGFYIKATCNSGYENTNIKIYNLPFTPMFSAAGGGMCAGAYISGGYNFQCFVAETSGTISTRVQACNNTSATNLSTSASGCNYRNGGGEITLSGTITFMSTT